MATKLLVRVIGSDHLDHWWVQFAWIGWSYHSNGDEVENVLKKKRNWGNKSSLLVQTYGALGHFQDTEKMIYLERVHYHNDISVQYI